MDILRLYTTTVNISTSIWFISLGVVVLTRNMDRQTDSVIPIY